MVEEEGLLQGNEVCKGRPIGWRNVSGESGDERKDNEEDTDHVEGHEELEVRSRVLSSTVGVCNSGGLPRIRANVEREPIAIPEREIQWVSTSLE
jgi:hypothetical protein